MRLASVGVVTADHVVPATGAVAPALLRPFGWRLPIEPIKGCSLTLPVVDTSAAPRASVTDARRKTVFARLGETLRVTGLAELVGHDLSLVPARLDALRDAVHQTFPLAQRRPWPAAAPRRSPCR